MKDRKENLEKIQNSNANIKVSASTHLSPASKLFAYGIKIGILLLTIIKEVGISMKVVDIDIQVVIKIRRNWMA